MKQLGLTAALILAAQTASADISGMWQTQPDRKDLTSHIEIAECGAGLYCGTVMKAFNSDGAEVQTPNIGRRLFWDMQEQAPGSYGGGTAYVPLINAETKNVELTLEGASLTVKGRVGIVRGSQVWTRIE